MLPTAWVTTTVVMVFLPCFVQPKPLSGLSFGTVARKSRRNERRVWMAGEAARIDVDRDPMPIDDSALTFHDCGTVRQGAVCKFGDALPIASARDNSTLEEKGRETMTAFNAVRFRVKQGREQEFLDAHKKVATDWPGLRHVNIIKTSDRKYCIIAE
jgi:hypothetical protein